MVNALLAGIVTAEEAHKAGTTDADVLIVVATVRLNAAAVVIGNFSLFSLLGCMTWLVAG